MHRRQATGDQHGSLYEICKRGDLVALKRLPINDIKKGLGVKITVARYTPLHVATVKGHVKILEYLLDKVEDLDPNVVDHTKRTPLHLAIANRQLLCADALLAYKRANIKLNQPDGYGRGAVRCAHALSQEIDGNSFFYLLVLATCKKL
eukprot:scpid95176/ scgid1818/ 